MAGQLTISTLNDSSGVLATQNGMSGIAKAWVNFNGTGTVAIRASFNVSSITDNGTGEYTANFTTAMPDANYATVSSNDNPDNWSTITTVATSSVRMACKDSGGTLQDASVFTVAVFR